MSSTSRHLLIMIGLLWERPRKVQYLSEYLGVSKRTIYRYLKAIEVEIEIPIDKEIHSEKFFIVHDKKSPLDFLLDHQ